jgi:hypothetical protein
MNCCDLHGRHCEPPSELCCEGCTEAAHGYHLRDGSRCSNPDLSGYREELLQLLRRAISWVSDRDHGMAVELDAVVHDLEQMAGVDALQRAARDLRDEAIQNAKGGGRIPPRVEAVPWLRARADDHIRRLDLGLLVPRIPTRKS